MAKVLNGDTGVLRPITDDATLIALANIFIAEKVAEDARSAAASKQQEMDTSFTPSIRALPQDNPAVKPHYEELLAQNKRASDYHSLSEFFRHKVEHSAAKLAEGEEPRHGLTITQQSDNGRLGIV